MYCWSGRPSNYFDLSGRQQWDIDKKLGILDWYGEMDKTERAAFIKYFDLMEDHNGRIIRKSSKK